MMTTSLLWVLLLWGVPALAVALACWYAALIFGHGASGSDVRAARSLSGAGVCAGIGCWLIYVFLDQGYPIVYVAAGLFAMVLTARLGARWLQPERAGKSLPVTLIGVALLVWAAVLHSTIPRHGRQQSELTACKSNLKNMGTAMEMYSTDWSGKYPTGNAFEALTPNYLKTLPACPSGGAGTYRMALGPEAKYNTKNYTDYYFIECRGVSHGHVGVPRNYPQYNGIVGLMER